MTLKQFVKNLFVSDAAGAIVDFLKDVPNAAGTLQKPEMRSLLPILKQGEPLLTFLESPLGEVVGTTLPFVKLATSLLKLYLEKTKREATLVEQVLLVSQAAYLESFQQQFLALPKAQDWLKRYGKKAASAQVKSHFKELADLALEPQEAQKAILFFQESRLAIAYNEAVVARMQDFGQNASQFAEKVARNTNRYMDGAIADAGVDRLRQWYNGMGREVWEKYFSLDTYLSEQIKPLPIESVFNEPFSFRDLYVPLQAHFLKSDGEVDEEQTAIGIEQIAQAWLTDDRPHSQVLFIQGNPGRGKSVFCRMFADRVRQHEHPNWTPILIRLRDVRSLEKDFEDTLQKAIDRDFADTDPGWLTDRNLRFLFLLDGFDELLMQGRTSGGLEDFLKQVGRFQESYDRNSEKRHRVLITGRTLSLQKIDRQLPNNLLRVELLPLDSELQVQWFVNWGRLAGTEKMHAFQRFLVDSRCPDRVRELAGEPLLLYLLAAMHRDGQLTLDLLESASSTNAKVLIYEKTIDWVLTKQRTDRLNEEITELDTAALRRILAEAGLCVVQSGGECATIALIESRLKNDDAVRSLLEQAQTRLQESPLRNALAAFYMQPGSKTGSVEFAHKSFSEFLFADRLKDAIEDWTTQIDGRRQSQDLVSDEVLHWQLYDLLGYGGLTPEIVEYLMALLTKSASFDPVRLFHRLEDFYLRWCDGEFIDELDSENLPQKKLRSLRDQVQEVGGAIGLRQVDVYTGLNVMILLVSVDRYARDCDDLKAKINFYPCGQQESRTIDVVRFVRITSYADCIFSHFFARRLGTYFKGMHLNGAILRGAYLCCTDFSGADLAGADLTSVNFGGADLSNANLSAASLKFVNFGMTTVSDSPMKGATLIGANLKYADLSCANLTNADLSGADFSNANLWGISWNNGTKWQKAIGLETAHNVPIALKQQLGLPLD